MSRITELNHHLFNQLERLSDPDMSAERLQIELSRTHAIKTIAKEVIASGVLAVEAEKIRQEYRMPSGSGKQLLEDLK